jgi:hypothetical protein
MDVAGAGGIGLDLVPEVDDVDAECAGILGVLGSPDFREALAVSDHAARVLDHIPQQVVLGG